MSRAGRLMSRGARLASLCALVSAFVASAGAGAAEQTVPIHLVDGSKPARRAIGRFGACTGRSS